MSIYFLCPHWVTQAIPLLFILTRNLKNIPSPCLNILCHAMNVNPLPNFIWKYSWFLVPFHMFSSQLRLWAGVGDPAAAKQPSEQLPGHLHPCGKLPPILKLSHEPSPLCRALRQLQEEFPQGNHFLNRSLWSMQGRKRLNYNCRPATVACSGRTPTHSRATTPSPLEGQFEVHDSQQCFRRTHLQGWGADRTRQLMSLRPHRGPRTAPRLLLGRLARIK